MADDGFNSSSLTWPDTSTTMTDVVSIDFTDSAEAVQVTDTSESVHRYVTGIPDPEMTLELVGGAPTTNEAVGVTGALAITWNDTTTHAIATAIITEVATSGGLDDKISTTLTFKPA
tara:strand:- start:913 stop:1263 length:351 start_codon:yes stop_codon:yes gene_type:complete